MTPLRFFDFELDPATGDLWRRGHTVPLERQPAIALACLASHAGRLVTRDQLRRAIWPDEIHVDFDRGMNYCIRQLRAALGDEARQPVFIETIPRQGYRFIAPIQRPAPAPPRASIGRRAIA
jgi:DNA-binding winged helix-turn-helix (wHTH) protein